MVNCTLRVRPAIFDRIDGNSVYEVIKLIEGVPLFFEDHLARMRRSAALMGADIEKPASAGAG